MFFVPIVPPTPQAPLSPRVRELSDLLGRVIEEYEKHHPAVTGQEVRMALQLASRQSRAGGDATAKALVAAAAGGLALAAGVAFFLMRQGDVSMESFPMVAVAVAIFSVLVLAVLLKRLSGG